MKKRSQVCHHAVLPTKSMGDERDETIRTTANGEVVVRGSRIVVASTDSCPMLVDLVGSS